MQKSLKTTKRGRGFLILSLAILIFNTTNAKAQTSITPAAPGSMIEGFTTLYGVKVKTGDTVRVWWEWASDATFSAPDTLPSKIWTKDSSKVRDTFTVAKHKLPPVDSVTGYTLYLRLAMQINGGAISFGTPTQSVIIYPNPLKLKVSNLSITPLAGGGSISFFGSTGSNYEYASVTFRFRYGSTDIWRKPNPDSTGFTGMNQSFSRTLLGMLSNKKVDLQIKVNNKISSWDTVITFTTTPTSTKPVVSEAAGKVATSDSAFIKIEATSFGLSSKFYMINTLNNDTILKTITSNKMETLDYGFGNLTGNTIYVFKVYGVNGMGTGNTVNITIITQPKLVTPTFVAKVPNVRWDASAETYYILPKLDWVTNSGDKVKRIDVRIYTDSLKQSVPMMWKVSDEQSGLTGPFTGTRIDSDSGRFWYEYVVETEKSIYTSSLQGYDVNWKVTPKGTTGIKPISDLKETANVEVYDAATGKLLGLYEFSDTNRLHLPTGQVLFVRYTDEKGQVYAGKIVVN